MSAPRCIYLGCGARAVHRVIPLYGRAWLGCELHSPAMGAALSIGGASSTSARTEAVTIEGTMTDAQAVDR